MFSAFVSVTLYCFFLVLTTNRTNRIVIALNTRPKVQYRPIIWGAWIQKYKRYKEKIRTHPNLAQKAYIIFLTVPQCHVLPSKHLGCVPPWKNSAKHLLNRNGGALKACSVATMAAEKAILCVLFEEFSEPDEIGINTFLILQNTLDVTVTALAVQNKTEHPNHVKGFVETVVYTFVNDYTWTHCASCLFNTTLFIYMLLLIGLTFQTHPPNKRKRISNPVSHRFQETCRSTRKP